MKDKEDKGLEVLWLRSRIHLMADSYHVQYTETDYLLSLNPLVAEEINDQ